MNSAVGLLGQIQELLRSPSLTNGRRHDAEETLAVAINVLSTGTEAPDLLEELERVVTELRRRLAPVKAVPIADEHLAQLEGLPDAPIFCWVAGKAPKYENWNLPKNLKTPLQIISETPPAGFVPTGVGMISGTDFLAVDFDEPAPDPETGEIKGSAEAEFLAVFKRPSSELPKSATTVSGKPGRRRIQLRVPKEWQGWLHDYSYAGTALEVRYGNQEKEGQASKGFRQSVICGPHPDSPTPGEWYFRWEEGLSPAEVGIAEAPIWFLQRLLYLKGCRNAEKGVTLAAGGENGTWFTSLPPQKQIELLKKMADGDHWPRRGGENGTHQAGHWPLLVKLGCGLLWSFNGNPNAVHHHFKDTTWARKFDWSDKAVHGSLLGWLQSLRPNEELRSTIGTLVWLATRTHTNDGDDNDKGKRLITEPYKLPKDVLPPKDPLEQVDVLTKIINSMNQSESNPIKMALLEGEGKRLGVTVDRLYELRLNALLGTSGRGRSPEEIEKSRRADNPVGDVIDGVLRRKVVALAGASNSGKTTLAAFMVRTVLKGDPLAIGGNRHHTCAGKVLWLTSDCSDEAVEEELLQQGINVADYKDRLRICDGATFNNMLDIVQDLQEFGPDLVVMDCLSSMALNGVSVADPAFVKPLRTLQTHNGKAWRRAAFVLLHHTTRDQPVRFSGGEQIKAAVEEMWIYYDPLLAEKKKSGERMKPAVETPLRRLWFEKCRSGFRGKELLVTYAALDNRWNLMPHSTRSLDPRAQLDEFFRNWRGDEWKTVAEWKAVLDEQKIRIHARTLERTMKLLAKGGLLEVVEQFHSGSGKTRPHYRGGTHVRGLAASTWEGTKDRQGKNELV